MIEDDGLLLVAGAHRYPVGYNNFAARLDSQLPAAQALAQARDYFRARGRGFTLITRSPLDGELDDVARAQGAHEVNQPWMVLDAPLPETNDFDLRWAENETDVRDAVAVNAEAYLSYGTRAPAIEALFARAHRVLQPNLEIVIAFLDGKPAATAMLHLSPGVGGIHWVGTRESARGRGLCAACTRAVANRAFSRGADLVTLQASSMGKPIYEALGFRARWDCRWWVLTNHETR